MYTVTWESAFWALAVIALNSMTQPAGEVCGFRTSHRFYLRSSPLVCAVDCLQILVKMSFCIYKGSSLGEALSKVSKQRFTSAENEEDNLTSVRENELVRWLVFALGTFTQLVKIFAFGGIPWTKTWAAMFVAAWVTVEILVLPTKWRSTESHRMDYEAVAVHEGARSIAGPPVVLRSESWPVVLNSQFPGYIAILATFVLDVWLVSAAPYRLLVDGEDLTLTGRILFVIFVLPLFVGCGALIGFLGGTVLIAKILQWILQWSRITVSFDRLWFICGIGAFISSVTFFVWATFKGANVNVLIVSGPYMGVYYILAIAWLYMRLKNKRWFQIGLGLGFIGMNFFCALVYYVTLYDEQGTFKPGWSEVLG